MFNYKLELTGLWWEPALKNETAPGRNTSENHSQAKILKDHYSNLKVVKHEKQLKSTLLSDFFVSLQNA